MVLLDAHLIKPAPILLFGYGNPGRGDDALGYLFIEAMNAKPLPHVECLTDMQLQVEHITDLVGREKIIFIDADVSCAEPYVFEPLTAQQDCSYTSHAMTPAALLHAYQEVYQCEAPPAYLLRIRGYAFELGAGLSEGAMKNLGEAFNQVKEVYRIQ
ncbi:hydrogenase maturation protease [Thiolinea disciformis]|uniref:hydrogenase maturation protease n=1 Tax=Thiolinea disciformis TaxID=125614 RepID=UPI000368047A|nr:hydrogenase maturation protease [Thiolinea disciformis]